MPARSWVGSFVFSWGLWLALSSTLISGSVHAQPAESPAYRELVEQALSEYGGKNYEEAASLFARAHQLYPNARTLRGMGMASFELRRYPESIEQLEGALASQVRPLDEALRGETQALLQRARGFVATVTVDLEPRAAELWLDGSKVESAEPLHLQLGQHVLEARQAGRQSERRVLRVRGGELLQVKLALVADGSVHADDGSHSERRPLYKNAWLWTGVGAVVAGAVVASVLLASREPDRTRVVAMETPNTPTGVVLTTLGSR